MNALIRKNSKVLKSRYDYLGNNSTNYTHSYRSYQRSLSRVDHISNVFRQQQNLHSLNSLALKPQYLAATINLLNYNDATTNCRTQNPADDAFLLQKRFIHLSTRLFEQPSSKVEATIQAIQKKKEEEIKKDGIPTDKTAKPAATVDISKPTTTSTVASASTSVEAQKPVVIKKPLRTRIWEEILHYYHGFRLLFVDINVCRKLLWSVLNGNTLTRRENKLLIRTTSDLFRLVPFSVFIIIPFMELLLPFFIKFFPGMLPSTFQTAKDREAKIKQSLAVKLEVAKFLQKTLDEMAVESKDHKSEDAKQFSIFFKKLKDPTEYVTNEEIIKFAKRFEDEITLDALSREQLIALCRVLGVNTIGTTNLLRFQLRLKMRNLAADDKIIAKEGVENLDLYELQLANKNRGMRAYGLSEQRLRGQLQEWIDLSLDEKVPPILLLLSRALMISEDISTADQLKDTIRSLPDTLAAQTKAAIGELEGKIDNKTKIEIIREEVRKIKEEKEEEHQEEKEKLLVEANEDKIKAQLEKDLLVDKAPLLVDKATTFDDLVEPTIKPVTTETAKIPATQIPKEDVGSISAKDVKLLDEALAKVAKDKNQLLKEKEVIKELKEEIEEYKEDVEELKKISLVDNEVKDVKESKAAQLLYKKVNSMIGNLDKVLNDLEKKSKELAAKSAGTDTQIVEGSDPAVEVDVKKDEDLVKVVDLIEAIKAMQTVSDEGKLQTIQKALIKIDIDQDGQMKVNDVMKVIEAIGKDNVNLNEKQIEELVQLIEKEETIEAEEKIEKVLAKEKAEKEQVKEQVKKELEELKDTAQIILDKATDLSEKKNDTQGLGSLNTNDIVQEAVDQQKDKLLPKDMPKIPPTIPTSTSSTSSKTSSTSDGKGL